MKPVILNDNRFDDGTPTATDTDSDSQYDVLNIKDLRTYTHHKFAGSGTKYYTIDCGSAKSADALAIISHNLKTANATVSVEYSSDNFSADVNVALSGFTPSDDKAFLKLFTSQSARYWRIKIVTASIVVWLGVAIVGERFIFERYPVAPFDPQPEKIISKTSISNTGNLLGSVIQYIEIQIEVSFKHLTPSWAANTFRPIWDAHLSQLKPFFWAWELDNHSDEVYFGQITEGFHLKMPYDPVRRSLTLKMRGVKE